MTNRYPYIANAFLSSMVLLGSLLAITFVNPAYADESSDSPQINSRDVPWIKPRESYSGAEFANAFRYKMLIGEYAPVKGQNVFFGEAEFAPGAVYVGHKHPAPEIYYVISGEAEWTVDGNTFKATPGTAIYTKPHGVHRMVNTGEGILKTIWMWWGEPTVLNQPSKIVEPIEKQPASAVFSD